MFQSARDHAEAPPLTNQRHLFDVPDDVSYFNTANMSPLLHQVAAAGQVGIASRARPWAISAQDWFSDVEQLRDRAAQVLGTTADGVALVPSTSYGLAVAAANVPLGPGERVLVLHEEYPSNYYTWKRRAALAGAEVVVVSRAAGQDWADAILEELDERASIVAVPNVHWTDGAYVDLRRVAAAARGAGAALVVDASQSLGAIPLDLEELRPAAVVAVGYKWLLGPFGVGYLYLAPHLRDGVPLEENWISRAGSEDFAALVDYTDGYLPGARRFDVGERSNFGLVPMAIAALDQILAWGVANIGASLQAINSDLVARMSALGLPATDGPHGPHMLGLPIPRGSGDDILAALQRTGVSASVRGGALRLSPHLHVTSTDCDRLVEALAATFEGTRARTAGAHG